MFAIAYFLTINFLFELY